MLLALIAILSAAEAHPVSHHQKFEHHVAHRPVFYWVRGYYTRAGYWAPGRWVRVDSIKLEKKEHSGHCRNH